MRASRLRPLRTYEAISPRYVHSSRPSQQPPLRGSLSHSLDACPRSLIVHEVGHIVQVQQVPEDERLAPALTREGRLQVAAQIGEELLPIIALGLSQEALLQIFNTWLDGTCTQLANFPADLRIEQWIHGRLTDGASLPMAKR